MSSDVLVITPEQMKARFGEDVTMAGYYLVAVSGAYGDNIHFSLRVSTKTDTVRWVSEGIVETVSDAKAGDVNYFIWENWGAASVNVYVTPNIGDVEIWMNSLDTDIPGETYNYLPTNAIDSTFSSRYNGGTRNRLEIDLSANNSTSCIVCYFIIGVKNTRATAYDVMVSTNKKGEGEASIQMFLPLNKVTQGYCTPSFRDIWMIPLDGTHQDDLEIRLQATVGHSGLYMDVGYKPMGYEIMNDFMGSYIRLGGETVLGAFG